MHEYFSPFFSAFKHREESPFESVLMHELSETTGINPE